MNIRLKNIAIGIGLIGLLTFLFFKTTLIDSETHNRFSNDLRHLKELDATLDKNILESRFGLQNSYDILMTESDEIQKLQKKLTNIPAFVKQDERAEFTKSLEGYSELQKQKNALIERFKSRNAIINNSLRYFPVTTSNLIKNLAYKDSNHNEMKSLNYLLRDTLIYYLLADKELETEIKNQIATLQSIEDKQNNSENKTEIDISIAHATTILRLKPEVDKIVKEAVELPTAKQIEELIKQYDSFYNESLKQANLYRLFLYIFSILLIGYIAYIIFKLKKATTALNAVNENLEERVQERTEELSWSNTELQNSRDYLDQIINAVGDPIFVKNRRHQLTLINHAMSKFIGHTFEESLGKTSHELFAPKEADVFWEKDELVFTSGEENVSEEQFTDQNGNLHTIITRKRLHIDKNGEQFIVGVSRDITENKRIEVELQRAQKLESIGQLAAGIAHEINTPTQYVGDNTRFLQDSFNDLVEVLKKNGQMLKTCREKGFEDEIVTQMEDAIKFADTEYLIEEIPRSIEQSLVGIGRIGKIVQSMKDFAHPGSVDKKATDLNKAIESTITVASNEWKYVAEMVTDFDPRLPNVQCLIGEFNQVTLNMIVNAAHAIGDVVGDGSNGKGTIRISTKHLGDWAEIRICDSGTGIREEIRNKIFDPFFTTKEVGKGSGQGLAICHHVITEKHKGKIAVESELGKGTTFIINLPIINEDS